MFSSKLFVLVAFLFINILFLPYYIRKGKYIFPGTVMLLWWDMFVAFFLLLDDGNLQYKGIFWILFCIIVYQLGAILGSKLVVSSKTVTSKFILNLEVMEKWIIVISVVLSIPVIYSFISGGGFQRGLLNYVSETAYDYYTSSKSTSFIEKIKTQIFTILMYGTPVLSGIYFMNQKGKKKYFAILIFIPSMLQVITTSGKLGFIITIFMFTIGVFVHFISLNVKMSKKTIFSMIKKYGKWGILALVLLFLALLFRFGEISMFYLKVTWNKFLNYAFGSIAAFNYWFESSEIGTLEYGKNTFTGILNALGVVVRERGVYGMIDDTYGRWKTNVYTAFRGIIKDFGLFGCLFFMFAVGFIAGKAYKAYAKNKTYGSLCLLVMSYLFILYSFIISPFIYLNLTVFVPIVIILYKIVQKIRIRSGR